MQTVEPNNTASENESMVLEEEIDENYEPTQEEILEYADYLGINPLEDKDLLYLAKEGLKAPLPTDWKPCQNREGKIYYFNFKTKQSQWEHPCDQYYKKLYQELKRKKGEKTQKITNSRDQSLSHNNPSKDTLQKRDSLPALKGVSKNQNDLQPIEESITIDDNQESFSLNPKGSSENFANSFNSEKKLEEHVIYNEFENFETLGKKQTSNGTLDDETVFEEKFSKYERSKQAEVEQIIKTHEEERVKMEKELKDSLESNIKQFKANLVQSLQNGPNKSYIQEKENLQNNLKVLYQRKFEEKAKEINKDFEKQNKKVEMQEIQKVSQELSTEEEDLTEQYEMKLHSLLEEKQKLKEKNEKLVSQEKTKEKQLEEELEKEKQRIEKDYNRILRENENKEKIAQKKEIQEYKEHLHQKVNTEKKSFVNVCKQKETLALKLKAELKNEYDRKLKLEQEKLDHTLIKKLKNYEDEEIRKKDNQIAKMQESEKAHDRETQQLKYQNEIDETQNKFRQRLSNYLQILKKKLKTEKEEIEREAKIILEKYENEVSLIETCFDVNEESFKTNNAVDYNEQDIEQIKEIDLRLIAVKDENINLEKKLDDLRTNHKSNSTKIVEMLQQQIMEADQILHSDSDKNQKSIKDFERTRSVPHLRPSFSKSSLNLNSIQKNVHEIKAFFTRRELNKSQEVRKREISRKSGNSKSSNYLNQSLFLKEKNHQDLIFDHPNDYKNWIEILNTEARKLQEFKKEMKTTKLNLKKVQESILNQRKSIKDYNNFTVNESENFIDYNLKKIKLDLNEQIQKVNDQVDQLKENQQLLKQKEENFIELEQAVEQFENNEITQDKLENLYKEYQENNLLDRFSKKSNTRQTLHFEKQRKSSNLSFRESYHRADQSILDSEVMEQDSRIHTARIFGERETLKTYNNNRGDRRPRNQVYDRRKSFNVYEDENRTELSYTNLLNVLDMKVKADSTISKTFLVEKEIRRSSKERTKITNVFSEHSKWLKDIKDQLNRHLYERPGKSGISFK